MTNILKDNKKAYPFKFFDFLLTDRNSYQSEISKILSSREIKGNIPTFFYRHSIFSSTYAHIDFYDGYEIKYSYTPKSISEVIHFDYILSHAQFKDGVLCFEESVEKITQDLNYDYAVYFENFIDMSISIASNGLFTSFSLFDSLVSNKDGVYIRFSQRLQSMYAFDYFTNYEHHKELYTLLLKEDKIGGKKVCYKIIPLFRNMLSRVSKAKNGISLSLKYFESAGIYFSFSDEVEFKQLLLKDRSELNMLLMAKGLTYNRETNTMSTNSRYIKSAKPDVYVGNIINSPHLMQAENTPSALNTALKEKSERETDKMSQNKEISTVLDFFALSLDKKFIAVLNMYEITDAHEMEEVFDDFKITYQSLQERKAESKKYKNGYRCFSMFLKNRYGERFGRDEEDDSVDDKPEIKYDKKKNTGDAENIAYDPRMELVTKNLGFSDDEVKEEFLNFRNYHIENSNSSNSWMGNWRTWLQNFKASSLKRSTKSKDKKNAWEIKTALENKHQIARMVDSGIRRMFIAQGVNPLDVMSGKIEVTDVVIVDLPIPSSMGKGTETLFEFKNTDIQNRAISAVLENPLSDFNENKDEVMEVELIEKS